MNLRVENLVSGLALVLLCLLLTACVEVRLKFDLRADGSGTAEWTIEVPKATADSLGMTAEKVKAEMLQDRQFQRPGVKTSTGRAANGNETATVSMPFSNVQELGSSDMAFEFQKTADGRQCAFRINARGAQMMPVRVEAEVRMPGKITGSNADSVSGNVARFNNVLRADGLWVQSEMGGRLSGTMLAVLLGALAAVALAVVVLMWMNRKRAAPAPVAAPAPQPATAGCPKCGTAVAPGKKFCHLCGQPLAGTAAPPTPPSAPAPIPPVPPPGPQPAKNNVMVIALAASLALLLIAIALLVYKLMYQNQAAALPVFAPGRSESQPSEQAAPGGQPGRPSPMPELAPSQPAEAPPSPEESPPEPGYPSTAPVQQPPAESQPADKERRSEGPA